MLDLCSSFILTAAYYLSYEYIVFYLFCWWAMWVDSRSGCSKQCRALPCVFHRACVHLAVDVVWWTELLCVCSYWLGFFLMIRRSLKFSIFQVSFGELFLPRHFPVFTFCCLVTQYFIIRSYLLLQFLVLPLSFPGFCLIRSLPDFWSSFKVFFF